MTSTGARPIERAGAGAYIGAMHAHDHHERQGPDLTAAARATLEKAGEQWTTMRASIFEVLAGFDKPASAYDIAEAVSKREGRRVAANSVYRILDLFVGANLARRVESANAYVANAHPDCLHDCIFLVCDSCGNTTHLDDDSITRTVRSAAQGAGFSPVRPVIEVRGKCADCD
jgi:Fur family zinc uptake transcriptional regulator